MKKKLSDPHKKKYSPPVQTHPPPQRKRKLVLLISFVVILAAAYIIVNFRNNSPNREAQRIISRAFEIAEFIPDSTKNVKSLIQEGLKEMKILNLSDGKVQFPDSGRFFIVTVPGTEMPGANNHDQFESKTMMEFSWEEIELHGKVAVLMNNDIENISHDLDVKATCLIHEMIHALQANQHLNAGQKRLRPQELYADERVAWNSQVFLYQKVHPEVFEGITCRCETGQLLGMNEFQTRILISEERDPMIHSLVLFSICKDLFLKKLYPEK